MKYTLTLLVLLNFINVFGQTEWAPIGATWHVSKREGNMPPNEGYVLWEVTKDTTILNKSAREIQKTYFHSNGQDTSYLKSEYTYEENDTVYILKDNQFHMLYNFNSVVGDKWTIYGKDSICEYFCCDGNPNPNNGTVIVDSIKTVVINNITLKAIYTSPDSLSPWHYYGVIIEKIGCLWTMLPEAINCAVDAIGEHGVLRCYKDSDIEYKSKYLINSNYDCNRLINYTSSVVIDYDNTVIFPNPANEYINISTANTTNASIGKHYEIIDIQGSILMRKPISNKIYVGNLNTGVYFLKLNKNKKPYFYKFIKK